MTTEATQATKAAPEPDRGAVLPPVSVAPAPRRARVSLTRVDPWSVMKLAFVLTLALAVVTVVAVTVLWWFLNASGVISQVSSTVTDITGTSTSFRLDEFLAFDRVLRVTLVIAAIDVVLITAIATLTAFLFNLAAGLVGGLDVTLTEGR